MTDTQTKLLAYHIVIDDHDCFVFAETAAKARWIAVRGYWEAGYGRQGTWPSVFSKRAPQYDRSRARHGNRWAFSLDHILEVGYD